MRPVSELNHYELLEVDADASPAQIERAYRLARATFDQDSLATYSVFDPGEAEAIRERIEGAYRELAEPESRRRYDALLRGNDDDEPADLEIALALETARPRSEVERMEELDTLEDESEPFDGSRLRRSRLHRGVDLDHIAQVTKISPAYLQFIEEERFAELPAPVYVRGFVAAYARCLGLDPERVAPTYMERFRAMQPPTEPVPRRRR